MRSKQSFENMKDSWPRGYKKIIINSAVHDIFPAQNVKMPTTLTFMSRKNGILGLSEPEKAIILDIFCT